MIDQNISNYKEEIELNQLYDRFLRNENADCDYNQHISFEEDLNDGKKL
jgi:hypothetical protein